jgi:hypothetical protein
MGGSRGDGSAYSGQDARRLAEEARQQLRRQEFLEEVNDYLGGLLQQYNDREVDSTNDRLSAVVECLGDEVADIDRLLFGGSVAKHTYVDGLSDVDALLVVRNAEAETPSDLIEALAREIRDRPPDGVADVAAGDLAVTVTYTDGSQIQILPAQEVAGSLRIASEDGTSWREIRPRKFAEKLTEVNQANAGQVIPAIKLAKAALQGLPEQHQLSGYHLEAIAVDAFRSYDGPRSRQAMLRHLLDHAASAVLRPTGDITGQSVHIDGHLGVADSDLRRAIGAEINRLVRRIDNATSLDGYRELFDG